MDNDKPALEFYFKLGFAASDAALDVAFEEVSGTDGSTNLVLKKGVASPDSDFIKWVKETISEGFPQAINIKDISLHLMDAEDHLLKTWNFAKAWPVKWVIAGLNASDENLAIEVIEFACESTTK
jgi:phage tail-like protein